MTLSLILVVAAAMLGFGAPLALRALSYRASPRVQLLGWMASQASFFYTISSAVVVAAWPNHAPAERVSEIWTRCLSSAAHTMQPWVDELIVAAAVTVGVLVAGRTLYCAQRQSRDRSSVLAYHRDIVAVVARTEQGHPQVMWLDHPVPMAYSVAGKPGFVVATEGLTACLTAQEREAVLAHERAHLAHRHHRIQTVCGVLAAAFPFIPLLRDAPASVAALLECEADRSAAEVTSAQAVRSALVRIFDGPMGAPDMNLNRDLRLRHLSKQLKGHSTSVTQIASVVLPLFTTAAMAYATVVLTSAITHTLSP